MRGAAILRCYFFVFGLFPQLSLIAQSRPFVPLEYEYPEAMLGTAKTYIYKNAVSGLLRHRDVTLAKDENGVTINWKEYDNPALIDSCTIKNNKSYDRYMIVNGQAVKAVISEDSIYQHPGTPREKVQTLYFDINTTISLLESIHSFYLKDTTITWQEKSIPCMVTQSFYRQKLTNSLFPDKPKEVSGVVYYYFGKQVGLLMFRSEIENEKSTWRLIEIKDRGKD